VRRRAKLRRPVRSSQATTVLTTINQDISSSGAVKLENRKFTRYFSFVHLHNAGWCDAEIELFRQALAKRSTACRRRPRSRPPVAIDAEKLIFRIDISDYEWDRDDGEAESAQRADSSTSAGNDEEIKQKELDKRSVTSGR
jgi:hypothetical protein